MPVLSIANIYAMSAPPGTIPYVPTAAELAIPTQTVTIIQNVKEDILVAAANVPWEG